MADFASIEEIYSAFIGCGMQVCTDTRKLVRNALFICLKGENYDANSFALQALEGGSGAVVTSNTEYAGRKGILLVPEGLEALQQLARHHRRQFAIPVFAITGSNGKTTNKELIHAVLSKKFNTLATEGNLNNHIGVPLTLLRLRKETEFAIIEMGANHQGEIAALCAIAEPSFGMITNIGKAHLEGFGGEAGVIKGKSEMYVHLRKSGGRIFVNGDDQLLLSLCNDLPYTRYGTGEENEIIGKEVKGRDTLSFVYRIKDDPQEQHDKKIIHTQLVGSYNLPNCLAAVCAGAYFGVPREAVEEALQAYNPSMNRSQLKTGSRNRIILDAYNANPDSMRSAIENFAQIKAERKMLLLGDMFELGEASAQEHLALVNLLKEKAFEQVLLVGQQFSGLRQNNFRSFGSTDDCKAYLQQSPPDGYTILIKGSRGMQMEKLAELL